MRSETGDCGGGSGPTHVAARARTAAPAGGLRVAAEGNTDAGARAQAPLIYGALDLGTKNCRLLIAKPSRPGFRVVMYDSLEEFYLAEALEYITAWRQSTPDNPVRDVPAYLRPYTRATG